LTYSAVPASREWVAESISVAVAVTSDIAGTSTIEVISASAIEGGVALVALEVSAVEEAAEGDVVGATSLVASDRRETSRAPCVNSSAQYLRIYAGIFTTAVVAVQTSLVTDAGVDRITDAGVGRITGASKASVTITGASDASVTITGASNASVTITGASKASATITGASNSSVTIAGALVVVVTLSVVVQKVPSTTRAIERRRGSVRCWGW
jgi:hypothetical protein